MSMKEHQNKDVISYFLEGICEWCVYALPAANELRAERRNLLKQVFLYELRIYSAA